MLYTSFRIIMMGCAFLSALIMLQKEDTTYILLPISMIVWALYSFFEPNDKEHLRRMGYGGNDWTSYDYYGDSYYQTTPRTRNTHPSRTPTTNKNTTYVSSGQYKQVAPRCKRSVKITLEANDDDSFTN